jgi:serine/threonine-protein kinase
MGAIYKVRQPVTGRMAALKLLKPADMLIKTMGMDRLRRQFEAEAVTMASLDHPHIAAVWDYDEAEGIPFFVMEYYCLNLGMLMGESYRVEDPTRRLPMALMLLK